MKGAAFFAIIDLLKAFWQMLLHPDSQQYFCFATPIGNKVYLRVPMGAKNSGIHFDTCFAKILNDAGLLRNGVEQCHDDILIHSDKIFEEGDNDCLYMRLYRTLEVLQLHNLFVHPCKLTLFSTEVVFGGYLFTAEVIHPSPLLFQALLDEQPPKTVGDVFCRF